VNKTEHKSDSQFDASIQHKATYRPTSVDPLCNTRDTKDQTEFGTEEFDWETLYQNLGEAMSEAEQDTDPATMLLLAQALRSIFDYVLDIDLNKKGAEKRVGRRFIGLCWVVNPAMFEGSPSLTKIAKKLGLSPRLLQFTAAEASAQYGIVNRGQAHGWNRKKLAGVSGQGAISSELTEGSPEPTAAEYEGIP
jgi:hypothetical protein